MRKSKKQSNLLSLLVTMLWLILSPIGVQADCYTDCMMQAGCWYSGNDDSAFCTGMKAHCSTECRHGGGSKSYGAIAYSVKDEAYGYSDNFESQEKAERAALNYCSEHGSDCEIMVWFYNSCGSVAADGDTVTWGQDTSEMGAKRKALDECRRAGGQNCEIKISHCSP